MDFELIAPFMVGLLGSLHCLGMCGPLVLACTMGLNERSGDCRNPLKKGVLAQLSFNCGRLITYGLLGGLAGWLFGAAEIGYFVFQFRQGAHFLVGGLLVLTGLLLLRVIPVPAWIAPGGSGGIAVGLGRRFLRSQGPISRLCLGCAAGLIPCCLSWAMVLTAASTGTFAGGFLTMLAFWAGTVPALIAAGVSSLAISMRLRLLAEQAAAVMIVLTGLVLISKGAGLLA